VVGGEFAEAQPRQFQQLPLRCDSYRRVADAREGADQHCGGEDEQRDRRPSERARDLASQSPFLVSPDGEPCDDADDSRRADAVRVQESERWRPPSWTLSRVRCRAGPAVGGFSERLETAVKWRS